MKRIEIDNMNAQQLIKRYNRDFRKGGNRYPIVTTEGEIFMINKISNVFVGPQYTITEFREFLKRQYDLASQ